MPHGDAKIFIVQEAAPVSVDTTRVRGLSLRVVERFV